MSIAYYTMTELENTDSLENVTVTNDAAFERVTSDIKMEEWEEWWYLRQNTAWLVQEIPNISILDISDFLIENKKTLYNRQNWNIVVGKAGRSIEAQPQDIARLVLSNNSYDYSISEIVVPFDRMVSASKNLTTYEMVNHKIVISVPWVYRVSYWWSLDPKASTDLRVWVYKNGAQYITSDEYKSSSQFPFTIMSWWKTAFVECEEWDELELHVFTDYIWWVTIQWKNDTYLEVQYLQQSI